MAEQFLSTPSARRATDTPGFGIYDVRFLSTPSARRATLGLNATQYVVTISIHALREEGDQEELAKKTDYHNFYPRPPRGGRHEVERLRAEAADFYPRPPRGGRHVLGQSPANIQTFLSTPSARRATSPSPMKSRPHTNFYPRPPRGGRQQKQRQNLYFQTNYTTFCTNLEEP